MIMISHAIEVWLIMISYAVNFQDFVSDSVGNPLIIMTIRLLLLS